MTNREHAAPLAVVLNPGAGRGLAGREWPRLRSALETRGYAVELILASSPQGACAALGRLDPDIPVLAAGGDGTAHALLPELSRSGRALALMPLGSGNDLAGRLGLRPGDVAAALDRLRRPAERLDLLRVKVPGRPETLLLNGLGMGFDAQVAALLHAAPARVLGLRLGGFTRYLWAAVRGLRELESVPLTLVADGQQVYHGPSCLAAVMNGSRYGGGFQIAPTADPQDGRLDVVWGEGLSRSALLPLMARVLRGSHLTHRAVHHHLAQAVTLRWERAVQTHLDGELAGAQQTLSAQVLPGALRMLSGR